MKVSAMKWTALALCCALSFGGRAGAQDAAKAPDVAPAPAGEMDKMPALLLLDYSDKVWSLSVGANSSLTVQHGDIVINSTNKGALWLANGMLNDMDGQILCTGGLNNMGKTSPKPYPVLGANPQDDPIPDFRVPPPDRVISQQKLFLNNQPEVTLPPGIYNDGIFATGADSVITMQPGVYIINGGDFFVSGALLQGKDVTIVMAGAQPGRFWTAAGAQLDLTAPTQGVLKNLLLISRAKGWNMLQLGGGEGHFNGLVYAPKAGIGISAGAKLRFDRVVCANFSVDLGSNVTVTGKPTPLASEDELNAAEEAANAAIEIDPNQNQ